MTCSRLAHTSAILAIVLLLLGTVVRAASAPVSVSTATPTATSAPLYLPAIRNGAITSHTAQIYACQCGAVSAQPLADGRVLLTILDHSRGGVVVVGIDNGMTFRELDTQPYAFPGEPEPLPTATPGPAQLPRFDFPGEKQGIGDSLEIWGAIVTWAPSRTEVDGRYNIWRFVGRKL